MSHLVGVLARRLSQSDWDVAGIAWRKFREAQYRWAACQLIRSPPIDRTPTTQTDVRILRHRSVRLRTLARFRGLLLPRVWRLDLWEFLLCSDKDSSRIRSAQRKTY